MIISSNLLDVRSVCETILLTEIFIRNHGRQIHDIATAISVRILMQFITTQVSYPYDKVQSMRVSLDLSS